MSNTEQMVSVPRELLNCYLGGDDSDWVEAGNKLRALLAQPAAQQRGEPVERDERAEFEEWMGNTAKIVVGSSDPYPSGLERDYWRVWQARAALESKP